MIYQNGGEAIRAAPAASDGGDPRQTALWKWTARHFGEATADLPSLPLEEFIAEIEAWRRDHDTANDLAWPAEVMGCPEAGEFGAGPRLPA